MATYYARKSGNVNATDVWATTPSGTAGDYFSSFTNADVLMANSFTVTLNVNVTVKEVRNDTTGSATAGGSFTLNNSVTLTADIYAGTANCVSIASSAAAAIVGSITAGSASGTGVTWGSTAGNLTITGNVTSGTGNAAFGIIGTSSSTLTIVGNVTSGGSHGIHLYSNSPTVVITGAVNGGLAAGVNLTTTGTATIIGTATGGTATAGFIHSSATTCTVTRAKGGASASAAVGVSGSTTGATYVEEIEYGDLGASPTSGPIRLTDKTSNVAVMYRFGTTKKTLTDPNASGLMPAESNVRSGTVYNGGNSTGTCAVPAASSVAFGVPVDATTGTAALTPAAVWDYLTASATTSGSMGERLKNAATVASVGQALSDALTP